MALINWLIIDHCFVTGRCCDNHDCFSFHVGWSCVSKNNCTDSAKVFFFQVGLMKNTANVGTTQTVHYHVQNLPQKCKPQQLDCRPRLAVSWETGWDEFSLVQWKTVTSVSKAYWQYTVLLLHFDFMCAHLFIGIYLFTTLHLARHWQAAQQCSC